MFQRPVRVKSNTVTKGSDRKKLRRDLSTLFPASERLLPPKCSLVTARLVTHGGDTVTVFMVDGEPLFFDDDGTIFPTVYTLWQLPEMLPCVSTWPQVLPRLQGGADLMLPGVVGSDRGGLSVEGIARGQTCAINLVGNRSPVGVGVSLMSWGAMVESGMRGKGFKIVHLYGDHLWKMGSKQQPPLLPMETPPPSQQYSDDSDATNKVTGDQGTTINYPEVSGDETVDQAARQISESEASGYHDHMRTESPELAGLFTASDDLIDDTAGLSESVLKVGLDDGDDGACLVSEFDSGAVLGSKEKSSGHPVRQTNIGEKESVQNTDMHVSSVHKVEEEKGSFCAGGVAERILTAEDGVGEIGEEGGGGEGEGEGEEQVSGEGGGREEDEEQGNGEGGGRQGESEGGGGTDGRAEMVDQDEATGISGNVPGAAETTNAMDDLLTECFLQALKVQVTKSDLPLLTSTFYRSHMLVLCPADRKLDIKKTSYKKLSKFLGVMESRGLIQVVEQSQGVQTITDISFKHPLVSRFSPKLLIEESQDTSHDPSPSAIATPTSKMLRVTELFMPSHQLLPLFSPLGYTKGSLLEQSGVREAVTRYVKSNELASKDNPSAVVLDPVLSDAVHRRGEPHLTQLTWQQLMERVLAGMRPAHRIHTGNEQPIVRKGKLEPVRLTLAQRTGNKKVTLVDNLDSYLIPPAELAHTVQRSAAASSTVSDVPGRPNAQQVLVQGNAVKLIARLLQDEYGLPVKHIEAIDRLKTSAPKKKKSGKR